MSENYKCCFEDSEKQLSKAMLQISKDRLTIEGLNVACMMLEKNTRETIVKLHEAVVIINEMSNPIDICQSKQVDRCKCELCVKARAIKFVSEIGLETI